MLVKGATDVCTMLCLFHKTTAMKYRHKRSMENDRTQKKCKPCTLLQIFSIYPKDNLEVSKQLLRPHLGLLLSQQRNRNQSHLVLEFRNISTNAIAISLIYWTQHYHRRVHYQQCFKKLSEIKSLWFRDNVRQDRYGSTLAEEMACCLTAPIHYLDQCWLLIWADQWHSAKKHLQCRPSYWTV